MTSSRTPTESSVVGLPLSRGGTLAIVALAAACADAPFEPSIGPSFSLAVSACTVTSLADDGSAGTLRALIADRPDCATIDFAVTGAILLDKTLTISRNVDILGPGLASLAVSGQNATRVFEVSSGTVTLAGLTIRDGQPIPGEGAGGALLNRGVTTLTDVRVTANRMGAVVNRGTLVVERSTIDFNEGFTGAGVQSFAGSTLLISHSTLAGNISQDFGGAVYTTTTTMTVENSTISGNSAVIWGGGLVVGLHGAAALRHVTITGNSAGISGGLHSDGGNVTLTGVLLAHNTASIGPDCAFTNNPQPVSLGYNVIGTGNQCASLPGPTDLVDAAPLLAPLADNGGPTMTHALLPGSPGIDHVPAVSCGAATDQRGVVRPQGGACDAGAFEVEVEPADETPPVITATVIGTQGDAGWYVGDVTVTWSVSDPDSDFTTSGCDASDVTADTDGVTFTCTASSAGGVAAESVTITRDATPPTVTYSGNAGAYTVDQTVSITCAAADATGPGSGLAFDTCANVTGDAFAFGVGAHSASATARDIAGNTGSASAEFTVSVTHASLCTLTKRLVSSAGIANALCAQLDAAAASAGRGNGKSHLGQIGAFINLLRAQSGKSVSAQHAAILTSLAGALQLDAARD